MRLFTPATHRGLHRDAYLVDTGRLARPLVVRPALPLEHVVDAVLDRVSLVARSPYDVRNRTFALFAGPRGDAFAVATTEPFHDGVTAALRDALAGCGDVAQEPDARLRDLDLAPLLAYERGRLAFFETPETRAWLPLAGRRGLPLLAAALAHAPDPDVHVGDVALPDYLAQPEEVTLDLERLADMPDDELEHLLDEQIDGWRDYTR